MHVVLQPVNIQPDFSFHVWTQKGSQIMTRSMKGDNRLVLWKRIMIKKSFAQTHKEKKNFVPRYEPEVRPLMFEEDSYGR